MARQASRRRLSAALALATVSAAPLLPALLGTARASASGPPPTHPVVVSGPGDVAAAVRAVGGTVTAPLPLARGVAATLPVGARLPGFVVAEDRSLSVSAASDTSTDAPADTARETMGLSDSSPSGAGVTVAVVDTGVADVPDLAGRLRHVDVTAGQPGDGYGHGTFMAGLVGADGTSSQGTHQGAAPQAGVLDVRVAEADGTTSLSRVLRGLQAVAVRQRALNIRVVNLSLNSNSPLPRQQDPLDYALDALWHQGITVVVSAGNSGPAAGTISSPADDPTLLTVGSADENGTADRARDTVSEFSSRGVADATGDDAKPDLVAPGVHVVSLRAPGSIVDAGNPTARVDDAYFRGSGTSMSAALVSGAVADLLSARPELTPDQVKAVLKGSAYAAPGLADPTAAGSGLLDVAAAVVADTPADADAGGTVPGDGDAWDRFVDAGHGGNQGEVRSAWAALSPATREWIVRSPDSRWDTARSWNARSWNARSWNARSWNARSWNARSWNAMVFDARSWNARSWNSAAWDARSWNERSWNARSWNAGSWDARSWNARSWNARSWNARSWNSEDWDARSWNAADWG